MYTRIFPNLFKKTKDVPIVFGNIPSWVALGMAMAAWSRKTSLELQNSAATVQHNPSDVAPVNPKLEK
ncbi:uncharacterized protein N7529_009761 [Penicillium soppii]|uniref:uncharacterized protein n=1 Tax=Penicillium soppii TaxID=69789 RepID=UPI0025493A08|nr:uncharacterized protein N7529_009761 [Penicillium soppii]KAJ5855817.1 hypothetical protein N7529_009761 [Penicillium soppii]